MTMQSFPLSLSRSLLLLALLVVFTPGCAVTLDKVEPVGAVVVVLDARTKVYGPQVPIALKFWVDITNQSGRTLSLERLRIELRASPKDTPDWVALKQSWTYRYPEQVYLPNGKRFTVPIVPERSDAGATGNEFPLELLPAGEYSIVALVNGRHASKPYSLRIERPDTKLMGRR